MTFLGIFDLLGVGGIDGWISIFLRSAAVGACARYRLGEAS